MFDFPDNDDQDQGGLDWARLRRGQVPPIAAGRSGPDFSGMESEGPADIAASGPQRAPAELPAIDVPKVGGQQSANSTQQDPEAASKPKASIAGPSDTAPVASAASAPKASIAGPSLDPLEQDRAQHEAELGRLRSTGSGISQIHNPFLRGLARVGDIAGSALFPFQTKMIPGTEFHHQQLMGNEEGAINEDQSEEQKIAQTQHEKAGTRHEEDESKKLEADLDARPDNPADKMLHTYIDKDNQQSAIFQRPDNTTYVKQFGPVQQKTEKPDNATQLKEQFMNTLKKAAPGGNIDPAALTDVRKLTSILVHSPNLTAAEKEGAISYLVANPTPSSSGTNVVIKEAAANSRAEKSGERADARALTARDERRINEHDKAYVQPAEAVEKSYEMMDNAYKEYKDAEAHGQKLPTGAQSMVALSTHLSTTFGNVKGARITKDMIQEHLGARSVSDAALTAIQRFTNGDVLSPDQWDAFHDLIKQSRQLSWQTAVKEAQRKKIPVDFLPDDLQGLAGGAGGGAAPTADDLLKKYPPAKK